ncbi:GLPGLI family protein [Paenimyroides aestuarii]|uniref:GLPGLI family protein n=1 Tax=Paenimyroides aestuarii TaxID=2968490 RepID=A0ABY5NRH1_9FLAO|nr:GLPGLI family protein [Paenimyroides aestuarii]UUV20984.1 GLPGLI family protein [Paenimyroides aestuarii]
MKNIILTIVWLYCHATNAQHYKITYIEQYNFAIPVNFTSRLVISETGSLFLKDVNTRKQGYVTNPIDNQDFFKNREGITEQVVLTGTNEYTFYDANSQSFSFLVGGNSNVCKEFVDTPNDINWLLTNETKEIGKFVTHKAVANFRGREWEVWFTHDIPMSYGPWKLRGLPGLIVEAREKTGKIYFSAIKVEKTTDSAVSLYNAIPKSGVKKTYKEFVMLTENRLKESFESRRANLPRGENAEIFIAPRNGIELIYEWEEQLQVN